MVIFKVDCEKGTGPELSKRFAVKGYPTFLLLNADLEPTNRWWGYEGKADFSEKLSNEMADSTSIKDKQARYKKTPTLTLAQSLISFHESRGETMSALSLIKDSIGMAPDKKSELRLQMLEMQSCYIYLCTETEMHCPLLIHCPLLVQKIHKKLLLERCLILNILDSQ